MDYYSRVEDAAASLRERVGAADVAVVLGSGLGDFASGLSGSVTIPYGDIPHWPASAVVGHAGQLVAGSLAGRVQHRADMVVMIPVSSTGAP